jgi:hypothetical protein
MPNRSHDNFRANIKSRKAKSNWPRNGHAACCRNVAPVGRESHSSERAASALRPRDRNAADQSRFVEMIEEDVHRRPVNWPREVPRSSGPKTLCPPSQAGAPLPGPRRDLRKTAQVNRDTSRHKQTFTVCKRGARVRPHDKWRGKEHNRAC